MLKKFFKKRGKNKRVVLKKDEHAHRDWAIALVVFFFVMLAVVGLSGFIFFQINSVVSVEEVEVPELDVLDQELLQETLDYYDEKEGRYSRYQNEVPSAPEL